MSQLATLKPLVDETIQTFLSTYLFPTTPRLKYCLWESDTNQSYWVSSAHAIEGMAAGMADIAWAPLPPGMANPYGADQGDVVENYDANKHKEYLVSLEASMVGTDGVAPAGGIGSTISKVLPYAIIGGALWFLFGSKSRR